MIVPIIDEDGILVLKLEREPPVTTDTDGPVILEGSDKGMKLPSRSIQIVRALRVIKRKQLKAQLPRMFRWNSCLRAGLKESIQSPMAETLDHRVKCNDTRYGGQQENGFVGY